LEATEVLHPGEDLGGVIEINFDIINPQNE